PLQKFLATLALASIVSGIVFVFPHAHAQQRGRITGIVRDAAGATVADAVVVATNQITGREARNRTRADGRYTLQLPAGAYRVTVTAPYIAKFKDDKDKEKNYGRLALPNGAYIENIAVNEGKDTALDIVVERKKTDEAKNGAQADDKKSEAKNDTAKKGSDGATPAASANTPATSTTASSTSPANPVTPDAPLGYGGGVTVPSEAQTAPDRRAVRDRWRIGFPEYDRYGDKGARGRDVPFKKGRWYDPYNQSKFKGDYPVFGNKVFMIFSGAATTTVEQRRAPTPSNESSNDPGSAEFFGRPEQFALNNTLQFTFEMFHGDTTFRPRNWAIKISPTFSVPNYVNARENGIINVDVRRGTNRTDTQFSLEEAFGEVKLEDTNANFDFMSVRVGIQPFVSDFRGFIYSDNNLGARLFGGFANNQYQFNATYFSQLEKDTNSGLNRFDRRRQNIYIANIFRQDFIKKGYTAQLSFHYNNDRGGRKFDRNGFLVRPALIGDFREHTVNVGYLGFSGDGHIGRINLTNSYYLALGRDSRNPIAGRATSIRAQMGAVEASLDKDYFRFRTSFFYASGDKNPTDNKAGGFDAIFDDPNFVGGQFSYWNRQGIRLTQTGVGLVQNNSILPSLRSSKIEGQANFINPGIFIYNAGLDIDVTQRAKVILNANYMRFDKTESLKYVLFQPQVRKDIGFDYSVGLSYRPLLINNVTFTFGAATLIPGRGFRDIFTDEGRNCPANVIDYCTPQIINPRKPLYSLFAQMKLVF
ncbi:MAG: carboxypeptidase regulatory-like domain-containing protein, partial [Pyrinomonadaceae bacterium]